MSGKADPSDPFAGYTPVKVMPVSEPESQTPASDRLRKYRFGKKHEGGVSRTVKFLGLVLVSMLLVLLIAFLAYGFIYERPVEEMFLGPESSTNRVQRLAEIGREARARVRDLLPSGIVTSASGRPASGTNGLSSVERAFPVLGKMLERNGRIKKELRLLEDGSGTDVSNAAPAAVEAPVKKREIDPALKQFKGGRRGKRIDNGGTR